MRTPALQRAEPRRDTRAEVDREAIRSNVRTIRAAIPASAAFMAVVKADGYGHGAIAAAEAGLAGGADSLAVAFLSEALQLRRGGIRAPILVLTPIPPGEAPIAAEWDVMLTVASAAWMAEARSFKNPYSPAKIKVHVKLDTGLGRLGLRERGEWEALVPLLAARDVSVEGAYTHLATAGGKDTAYVETQIRRFREMTGWIEASGIRPRRYHCAGSAAALRFPELAMDMVRFGAAMYGFCDPRWMPPGGLRPALRLTSRLVQAKYVAKGERIGYDNGYAMDESGWIGTVPIGYADGWGQGLQGADVLIEGNRCPIVGRIGMDQLMVRLPRDCPAGTTVTLIGEEAGDCITCAELADRIGSVPQEISTALATRVERMYK
ncbi:alanine racemase [Cohnella sp. REN36]|uniref:alanine racemase n=1 Tax=Cohnella sp. REN36 TaxID=2887347 RepID=UPI001D1509AC|nr:alanine racemase [Cohnella sp. REN36]MCC3371659.1 alanine racemase [Cohnella sp. REN36]